MGRRGNNEGSIRKRSDGRWEARITIAGKQRSVYGKTREIVARKMRDAMSEAERGLPVADQRTQLQTYLREWLENTVKLTVRPKTYESYEGHIRLYIEPAIGKVPLVKLTLSHVQQLMNGMLERGLSPRTVIHTRATLRRALGQAHKWGLVSRNVAALVDPPKAPRSEVMPLTPEQARLFLDAIEGDRFEALYHVALALGMRQGEILGLTWSNVDLSAGTLRVKQALQKINGEWQLVEPKTKRSRRTLPLPATVASKLREHRARQNRARLNAGDRWQDWGLVFTTGIGTPLDGVNVNKHFQRTLAALGLPKQRFHDLRHACATFLLTQGLSPRVVMETLGHSQISVTMDTYSHVMPELQREAADRMDELLNASDPN